MIRKAFTLGTLILAFALSANSSAEIYANVQVGNTDIDESTLESDTGFKIGIGSRLNKNFSVEVNYVDLGTFDLKSKYLQPLSEASSFELGQTVIVHSLDVETSGFDISLLGSIPFNDMFAMYARAGLFVWDSDLNISLSVPGSGSGSSSFSDDGTDISMGIGLQLNPSPSIGITLGYDEYEIEADGEEFEVEFTHLGIKFYYP